jgi:glutamine synthetase type III
MAEKLNQKKVVTVEEAIIVQAIESEALVNLLEKKGLIDKKELLEEIKMLREKYMK